MAPYDLPEALTVEADGPIRIVTLNRADERNAIDAALHRALAVVWRQLAADAGAKVVVLTGAGPAFSAGGDLDWITSFLDDPVARDESLREGAEIVEEMLRFPHPVIAAVNGPAVGLGLATRVVPATELLGEACDVAAKIARQPTDAVRGTKRVLNMHLGATLGTSLPAGFAAERVTMMSSDHRERVLALRRPRTR